MIGDNDNSILKWKKRLVNISKFDELGHIEQQWQEIKVTGLSFCCSHNQTKEISMYS